MDWNFTVNAVVKKTPNKEEWCVESESGKNLGCSDSPGGAAQRLQQVEMFKHMKNKKGAAECPIGIDHIHEDLREFGEIDEHLSDAKKVVKNMVHEDKDALKKAADLGTHFNEGNDAGMYAETVDTDLTHRDKVVPTWDDKNPEGVSKGHQDQRDHNETMITQDVMDRKEMPKVDYRDPKKISENANGEFYDATNNPTAPKEGEVLGLQPSYSAAEVYMAISKPNQTWGFGRESLFDQFIGNVGEILTACKQAGASRAAAREAVIQVHSALFAKHEWMSPILDRFLDRAFGTSAKPKSALSTLEGCITDYVTVAHKNGWDKTKTVQSSLMEFSSWIENYPDTQRMIEAKIDAAYGVDPNVLKPFLGKNAVNQYAVQLVKDFNRFPVSYSEFRRWCSVRQVPAPTLYALERTAVELHYVAMPEVLVIFADDQELYVSDDKTKTQALPKNPDTTKNPEEITLADGTKLKRMKE